jgi:hypothetical protein
MLRLSWGISGRQPSDAYARFATFNSSPNGNYILNPAIIPTQVQLNNLRWENIESYNLGIDLNMFDDRVFIQAEVYTKVTRDLLFFEYQIPYSSGYDYLK